MKNIICIIHLLYINSLCSLLLLLLYYSTIMKEFVGERRVDLDSKTKVKKYL